MGLDARTRDFMERLASASVDAANISAERSGGAMYVRADLPTDAVNQAQSLAAAYGFSLDRREGDSEYGQGRYRFVTRPRPGERGPADRGGEDPTGWDLPGGVR